jgi:hypothetical protein
MVCRRCNLRAAANVAASRAEHPEPDDKPGGKNENLPGDEPPQKGTKKTKSDNKKAP